MATQPSSGASKSRPVGVALFVVGVALIAASVVLFLRGSDPHSWAESSPAVGYSAAGAGVVALVLGLSLFLRGAARDRAAPATFLTPDEEQQVVDAIGRFEKRTSGELRVHLEGHVDGDILDAGKRLFEQLGLTATRDRNGVMFLVALKDHRFAVLGDKGIDERVPPGFWSEVVTKVQKRFGEGAFAQGLVEGVELAGEQLATHFPPRHDDVNELPDQISRGPRRSS